MSKLSEWSDIALIRLPSYCIVPWNTPSGEFVTNTCGLQNVSQY